MTHLQSEPKVLPRRPLWCLQRGRHRMCKNLLLWLAPGTRCPIAQAEMSIQPKPQLPAAHPRRLLLNARLRDRQWRRGYAKGRVKEFLVQLNINEEHYDQEVLHDNPQHLSSALRKGGGEYVDDGDGDGEEFDFHTVEAEADSDSGALSVRPVKEKVSCYAHNLHATD